MFGSNASGLVGPRVPKRLLVRATPEIWSDLLNQVRRDWEITWAESDRHFVWELARGYYPVAAFETWSTLAGQTNPLEQLERQLTSLYENPDRPLSQNPAPVGGQTFATQFLRLQRDDLNFLSAAGLSQESAATAQRSSDSPDTVVAWNGPSNAIPYTTRIATEKSVNEFSVVADIGTGAVLSEFQRWLDVAYGLNQLIQENQILQRRLINRRSPLIGTSAPIQRLREQIAFAAGHDWPVLIQGEPGTGRDLVARAIHEASDRAHRPFVKIDCRIQSSAALSRELFGPEMDSGFSPESRSSFGHDSEGSTVRSVDRASRLELAEGGILLIEGIDEIALPLQTVLAQVMERQRFQRPGAAHDVPFNVRIVAITQKDLEQLRRAGQFREDLLTHFVGPVLQTPALRDIAGDLAPLAEHLLQRISARLGVGPIRLYLDSLARLQSHSWPGNVAELEALLERACLLNPSGKLTPELIESWLTGESAEMASHKPSLSLAQMERQLIEATFTRCGGNRELTAQSLQIGLRTLSGKLREYGYPPRGGPGSNRPALDRDAA